MDGLGELYQIGQVVVGAAVLLAVTRRAGVPPLLAYILAGLLLGPVTGLLDVTGSLHLLSELGVALLLFLVGMELSLERIREVGRPAVLAGGVQMGLSFLLGWGAGALLGFPDGEAVLLGLALTFSSTAVVVKLLDRVDGLSRRYGRMALGVLLLQDVAVALVLAVVAGLGAAASPAAAPAAASPMGGGLGLRLLASVAGLALLVGIAAAGVRLGLGRLFRWLGPSTEGALVVALAWGLLFIAGAEAAHLSVELGAFVAGVALAQLPACTPLRRRVHPLVDFFLAFFFVTLGAGADPAAALRHWPVVASLTLLAVAVKPALVGIALGRLGESDRSSFLAGLSLGQISEFAFVLAAAAVAGGMARPDLLSVVTAVGLLSMGVSALLFPQGDRLLAMVERVGVRGLFGSRAGDEGEEERREGHAVVVGMNALGRAVVSGLAGRGREVVAVDTDAGKLEGLPAASVTGDVSLGDVLEEAGLDEAGLAVSALQIEGTNRLFVRRCADRAVPVSVHVLDPVQEDELVEAGADHLMASKVAAARAILRELHRQGVLPGREGV